jgi:mannose-6-phosphate isomerase-like protein (cupin superfamily)
MERTVKSWGEKWNVFENDLNEVSILYLNPMQRCSWHKHQTKYNQFFVIEGEIWIKMGNDSGPSQYAHVRKNQIFTTRPGEMHEFQTRKEPAVIQEVMFVQYDAGDIQREDIGGPINYKISDPVDMKLHGPGGGAGCKCTEIADEATEKA